MFFEKLISNKSIKKLEEYELDESSFLMCDFFYRIEESFLAKPNNNHDNFFHEWEKKYSNNPSMLKIGVFVHALMDNIPIQERKKGTKAIKEAIAGFIKNDFSHYFELSEIVRSNQPFSIDELLNSIENEKVFTTKSGS